MAPRRCIIPIFVPHLGCPNCCIFCNQRSISGMKAPVTAEGVTAAIADALDKIPQARAVEVAFYGGSFTAIPEMEQETLLRAVQPFIRSGRVECLRVSTRPDCVNDSALRRLADYGVRTVELGAQSMDEDVLRLSLRGHTAQDVQTAAGLVKSYGFALILQMMTGLPGDSREKSLESGRKIAALRPDGVRIYPTVVVRNTELFEMWQRGQYHAQSVEEATEVCADLLEIMDTAGIAVIRVGLNPTQELGSGEAAAGAYHPALGELARSRQFLRKARLVLSNVPKGSEVILGVRSDCVSLMIGQKRQNIGLLCEQFGLHSLKIRAVQGEYMQIVLLNVARSGKN